MSDILERLRETPTVTLPQAEAMLPVASTIRQMMVERAEAADTIAALLEALRAAAGYLTNAKIDLETGCTKATAIKTIEGGLARVKSAIALASPSTQTGGERK